jgi:hypothetical protein
MYSKSPHVPQLQQSAEGGGHTFLVSLDGTVSFCMLILPLCEYKLCKAFFCKGNVVLDPQSLISKDKFQIFDNRHRSLSTIYMVTTVPQNRICS